MSTLPLVSRGLHIHSFPYLRDKQLHAFERIEINNYMPLKEQQMRGRLRCYIVFAAYLFLGKASFENNIIGIPARLTSMGSFWIYKQQN